MAEITTRDKLNFTKRTGKIGFTSGVFDILHAGHVDFLEKCKAKCDTLVVGVNSDASAEKIKRKPINCLEYRMKVLSGLSAIDYLFDFNEQDNKANVEQIKPNIYFKGGDYEPSVLTSYGILKQYGGKVIIIPMEYSINTTEIIFKCHGALRWE